MRCKFRGHGADAGRHSRATVAIGEPGATNAGILAAQILGVASAAIRKKLAAHKEQLAQGVEEKSRRLRITLGTS